jgi:hypothetical protein
MWNTAVMVVASGIILALDHILKPASRAHDHRDRRPVVASIAGRLRQLQDPSGIASRGANLVDHLLALGDQRQLGLVKDVTVSREAVLQLVTSSQNAHIPDDMLWQQYPPGVSEQGAEMPFADPFAQVNLTSSSGSVGDQAMWTSGTDDSLFSQSEIDFDFARLLGQIMPNAG